VTRQGKVLKEAVQCIQSPAPCSAYKAPHPEVAAAVRTDARQTQDWSCSAIVHRGEGTAAGQEKDKWKEKLQGKMIPSP
jgi:hypothetical protein